MVFVIIFLSIVVFLSSYRIFLNKMDYESASSSFPRNEQTEPVRLWFALVTAALLAPIVVRRHYSVALAHVKLTLWQTAPRRAGGRSGLRSLMTYTGRHKSSFSTTTMRRSNCTIHVYKIKYFFNYNNHYVWKRTFLIIYSME